MISEHDISKANYEQDKAQRNDILFPSQTAVGRRHIDGAATWRTFLERRRLLCRFSHFRCRTATMTSGFDLNGEGEGFRLIFHLALKISVELWAWDSQTGVSQHRLMSHYRRQKATKSRKYVCHKSSTATKRKPYTGKLA